MYYIEKTFRSKLPAKLFAIFGMGVALIGIGTFAQTKSISAVASYFCIPDSISAILLGAIVALITFGGIHRIADVAEKIVPFMTILYVSSAIIILILKFDMIIPALNLIITDAFEPRAVIGGGIGATVAQSIQIGISRGIFCHEAGLGSAAIAAAAAKINSPVKQGLICMVGAFLSIIICVVTGLVLITTSEISSSGVICFTSPETSMTAYAFGKGLGMFQLGTCIVNLSILFFAFTTIIGWNYYGEKCIQYAFSSKGIGIYRLLYVIFVIIGPFLEIKTTFVIADIVIGLMAIPNILSLIALRKEIVTETLEFFRKEKFHDT